MQNREIDQPNSRLFFPLLFETTAKTISKCAFWKPEMCNLQSICKGWGEKNIYRNPLVILGMKSTHKLQTSASRLECLQQIFTAVKTVTEIILRNGIEQFNYVIRLRKTTSKTKKDIFKNHFPFIKFSLPDIRDMINQNDDADLKSNEIKSFLINKFGDSIS